MKRPPRGGLSVYEAENSIKVTKFERRQMAAANGKDNPANLRPDPHYRGDLGGFRAMAKILSLNRFPVSRPPEIRCHVTDGFFGTPP